MSLISARLRKAIVKRAGNRCEYCRLSQDSQVATYPVDHVQPISLAGPTELANLALACPRCNSRKANQTEAFDAQTNCMEPLFNPRRQKWRDHFRWSAADATVIEPLTATGRATLTCLDLNGNQHLAIRSLLILLSLHPIN